MRISDWSSDVCSSDLVAALEAALDARSAAGEAPPKFIYNIPEFHNPTGATMPAARREALIALAETRGIPIVEDSPYRPVRFEGADAPQIGRASGRERVCQYV